MLTVSAFVENKLPVYGGNITLICNYSLSTTSKSNESITWKHNRKVLATCHRAFCSGNFTKYKPSFNRESIGNVTIMDLTPSDNGEYRCKVDTVNGTKNSVLRLAGLAPSKLKSILS